MSTLVEFDGVTSGYGDARVLHGINLSIETSKKFALLGRNGAGKTTLIATMLGIARLMSGSVRIAGNQGRIRKFTAARCGISVVPQGRRIIPNLTVAENLMLGRAVRRSGPWNVKRIYDLFPILSERADTPGTALSGGQQQMLAIGRALMANPLVLVLDEPSEGLAPVIVDELGRVLNMIADEGTGIVLVEQHYGLVRQTTTEYAVLSKGAVVETGNVPELSAESLKMHVAV